MGKPQISTKKHIGEIEEALLLKRVLSLPSLNDMTFGQLCKIHRILQEKTIDEIAGEIGITRKLLGEVEKSGAPPKSKKKKKAIVDYFGDNFKLGLEFIDQSKTRS